MMPELIDMTEEEQRAACTALAQLLRTCPTTITEPTEESE